MGLNSKNIRIQALRRPSQGLEDCSGIEPSRGYLAPRHYFLKPGPHPLDLASSLRLWSFGGTDNLSATLAPTFKAMTLLTKHAVLMALNRINETNYFRVSICTKGLGQSPTLFLKYVLLRCASLESFPTSRVYGG